MDSCGCKRINYIVLAFGWKVENLITKCGCVFHLSFHVYLWSLTFMSFSVMMCSFLLLFERVYQHHVSLLTIINVRLTQRRSRTLMNLFFFLLHFATVIISAVRVCVWAFCYCLFIFIHWQTISTKTMSKPLCIGLFQFDRHLVHVTKPIVSNADSTAENQHKGKYPRNKWRASEKEQKSTRQSKQEKKRVNEKESEEKMYM